MTKFTIAHHFNVSQRTIERWEKQGMPVIKINKVRRYDLPEVLKWISLNDFSKEMSK